MGTTAVDTRLNVAKDPNAGRRVRLHELDLPEPNHIEAELRRIVLERLDPKPA